MTGFDNLIEELDKYEISEQKEKRALNAAGEIYKNAIEEAVVVKTGKSKRSVTKKIKRLDDGNLGCRIYIKNWYYNFEEWGTSRNKKNVGKVERAINDVTENAVNEAKDILIK